MEAGSTSHTGRERDNNEDSLKLDAERGIFLLADGMGGHQAGEVASRMAVEEAYAGLLQGLAQAQDETGVANLLGEALSRAHAAIMAKAASDWRLAGMGTTLVALVVKDGTAYLCHVGDSRAYLLREGLRQLTRDQTVGDYLVEHGHMEREEVPLHSWHTLTQAVGTSDRLIPQYLRLALAPGDMLLLCSDGLTDMLSDDAIEQTLERHRGEAQPAADALEQVLGRFGATA